VQPKKTSSKDSAIEVGARASKAGEQQRSFASSRSSRSTKRATGAPCSRALARKVSRFSRMTL